MKENNNISNYWFTVEPYVHIKKNSRSVLLYNTLDGASIESSKVEVLEILEKITQKDNSGVVLLKKEQLQNNNIKDFIVQLREKFMGDIIATDFSKGKPIQLFPLFNFQDIDKSEIYKKHNFWLGSNMVKNLCEITIHLDSSSNAEELVLFLQSFPIQGISINIVTELEYIERHPKLFSFLKQSSCQKAICCSYKQIVHIDTSLNNNFSYKILIDFPLNIQRWNQHRNMLGDQKIPYEYIFEIKSIEDVEKIDQLIETYSLEKYQMKPIFTGDNFDFFEKYVFLTKDEILNISLSIEDIFAHQALNIYDFGKLNIMPNGDAYANLNHTKIGNVFINSIREIVFNEINEGHSWFRVRNQAPCNNCIYQWLCPPPSDYELALNRINLCHIVN